MFKKLAIIDPNLIGRAGHYLSYACAVTDAANLAGISVIWITSERFPCELAPRGTHVRKLFSYDVFHELYPESDDWVIENFNQLNHRMFLELNEIQLIDYSECIFLFPNLLQNQLYAVTEWSKRLVNSCKVVCILRWQNAGMGYNVNRGADAQILDLYRFCIQQVASNDSRVLLASDTTKLADFYHRLGSWPVHRIPNPQVNRIYLTPAYLERQNGEIAIVVAGGFSPLRGSNILPSLVEAVIRKYSQVSFRIQVSDLESVDAQSLVKLLNTYKDRISLFCGVLDTDVYNHFISTASLVLMPYSPSFYYWGSSGVACEALSFGIPAVLTANTTMHDEFLEVDAGFVAVDTYGVESFSKGCDLAIGNLDELRRKSREASKRFIARSSPAVFLDSLLSLAAAN